LIENPAKYGSGLLPKLEIPALIDINAGCPVPKVVKTGAGSALMKTPNLLGEIVAAVKSASDRVFGGGRTPVSIKMRTGWDENSKNFVECAGAAFLGGASMVTLHARTRAKGYSGAADWSAIAELARAFPDKFIAGSGDVFTPEAALRMLSETGCGAVMVARGAMGNPFIFREIAALRQGLPPTPPSQVERVEMALTHLKLFAEKHGEPHACIAFRAHFCAYLKGLADAAQARERIVRSSTIKEYEEAVRGLL
jgi:nifR3 family TIM-barrel protein